MRRSLVVALLLSLPFPRPVLAATEKAILAGGCFWCMEPPFEKLEGVSSVVSGYTDGAGSSPTYKDYGGRGFVEAVEVTFDPAKTSYAQVLDVFWRQIDPTDPDGQFVDRGREYRSAIFYLDEEQRKAAEGSKAALEKSARYGKPIVTEIKKATRFWPAEDYHQDYAKKNPVRYKYYRYRSGRDRFLEAHWPRTP